MNYENLKKQEALPKAASMIETFRAIGYSLETAIADIVDNSISADAKNVWISRIWDGGNSTIVIEDDGWGMNNQELVEAMCPGLQNPLHTRNTKDLGRFGLGLKTASFSQCRKLSVISKKKGYCPVYWSWDLDYVSKYNKWELIKWMPEQFEHILDGKESGTVVIWTELDRIVKKNTEKSNENAKMKFSKSLDIVKKHLEMTFHRFIEKGELTIYWGGREGHPIIPWNPFCPKEKARQTKSTDYIGLSGATMKGYVLPHEKEFSSSEAFKSAEGFRGWTAQQGFYVYRGDRLLLAGDWLGLFKKEDQYKLVRIEINLPNKLDFEWHLDIKKSRAYPPSVCRDQLESYAKSVRADGCEVYKHRGKIIKKRSRVDYQPLWLEKKKDTKWSFVINRNHALIQNAKLLAKDNPQKAIETLLKFIEESIPTETIYIEKAQTEEKQKEPYSDIDSNFIKDMIVMIYNNYLSNGVSSYEAKIKLKNSEPFNNYEFLIDQL